MRDGGASIGERHVFELACYLVRSLNSFVKGHDAGIKHFHNAVNHILGVIKLRILIVCGFLLCPRMLFAKGFQLFDFLFCVFVEFCLHCFRKIGERLPMQAFTDTIYRFCAGRAACSVLNEALVDFSKEGLRLVRCFGVYVSDFFRGLRGVSCVIACGIVSHDNLIILLLLGLLWFFFLAAGWGFFRWSFLYRVLAFGRLTVFAF